MFVYFALKMPPKSKLPPQKGIARLPPRLVPEGPEYLSVPPSAMDYVLTEEAAETNEVHFQFTREGEEPAFAVPKTSVLPRFHGKFPVLTPTEVALITE